MRDLWQAAPVQGPRMVARRGFPMTPREPAPELAAPRAYWTCEIGPADRLHLPDGADLPMRQAIRRAFWELTGSDPEHLSSGWGRAAAPRPDVPTERPHVHVVRKPIKRPEDCGHHRVEPYYLAGTDVPRLWACDDCGIRFYPACRTCVDVGHRNVVHPEPVS